MKSLKTLTLSSILFFGIVTVANAAPWKADNPNIVTDHTGPAQDLYVVPESGIHHDGEDLVMKAGNSGVVHQWFEGTEDETGDTVGHHSVWKPEGTNGCPDGWTQVSQPYPGYGEQFQQGSDYCVKTNDYNPAYYLNN